ncbi:MAG: CHASE3 domain-containing protein [Nitrospirae bacterium]|nr:CHASE3 domain-containing protein [Nitrospirota bacterium]
MPGSDRWLAGRWGRLRLRQKVSAILLLVFVPLIAALSFQVSLINHLLATQQQHRQAVQTRYQILLLRRFAVDIEDAFRGYLLTGQEAFLKPLQEAQPKLKPTVAEALALVAGRPDLESDIRRVGEQLNDLMESKQALIRQVHAGHAAEVLRYVRSGEGLALSTRVRTELRDIEDRLYQRMQSLEVNGSELTQRAYRGLVVALAGWLGLGLVGARLLARSITGPLATLQVSAESLGRQAVDVGRQITPLPIDSSDEIGQLARSFDEMALKIKQAIVELETINTIGNDINTIGPDGLDGALRRITDRAVDLLQADVCLVLLRSEEMGCWIVEAASGDWHERLYKTVMLWEEFPVSVQAFESKQPAFGEHLRGDIRPEVVRRNLIGESMLAVPLLSQGVPFGVLVLLQERRRGEQDWNVRLAKGFADAAAIAIANARLYETAHKKEKGLESRLRRLEYLAEMLAHDLKAPGERMEEFASLLLKEYGEKLDARAARWLRLLEQNGKDMTERVHTILEVARVGAQREAVEAVDPALVLNEVLKARAGELERRRAQVHVSGEFPMVACHQAYLRQVFDNLLSNAVKFSGDRPGLAINVVAERKGDCVQFSVADNGIGIPAPQRARVFDPFVRLNPGPVRGSGIGLTIVRRIVDLYGGQVWIDANAQGGCTVMFTIPVLGDFTKERPSVVELEDGQNRSM